MAENTPGFIDPSKPLGTADTLVIPKKAKPTKKGTVGATGAKAPTDPNVGTAGSPGLTDAQKLKQKADKAAADAKNTKLGPGMNRVGVVIPANLISALGLQDNLPTNLLFFPGKGLYHAPATAKELWAAIGQLTSETQYTDTYSLANLQLLQAALKKAYFPAGFTGSGKDANKVFTAVNNNFVINGYKLEGLTLPTNAQLYGSTAATQIKNLQSTIDQQTVALSNASAAQEASAFGVVQNYLESWGLGSDKQVVKDMYSLITRNGSHITNTEELLNIMRGSGTSGGSGAHRRPSGPQSPLSARSRAGSHPAACNAHRLHGAGLTDICTPGGSAVICPAPRRTRALHPASRHPRRLRHRRPVRPGRSR